MTGSDDPPTARENRLRPSVFDSVVDLFSLAVRCQLLRFGSLPFHPADERLELKRRWGYDSCLVYDLADRAERGGGSGACGHELNESAALLQPT